MQPICQLRLRRGGWLVLVGLWLGVVPGFAQAFDHQHATYAQVLQRYVHDGLVDYRALCLDPALLHRYLDELAAVPEWTFESWIIPQRLAFLINLHNATALQMVVDAYPVPSFQRVSGLFRDPWEQPTVRLFGNAITLRILRDNLMRRDYAEPGIHFALVPAALGAPAIRAEPYVPDRLAQQLDDQARTFLKNVRNNRIDRGRRRLSLSPLFRWYEADFVKRAGSIEAYLRPYMPDGMDSRGFSVRYLSYDWALNDAQPGRP